jgi:TRAP-type C4-dicarboxylate transport system permease small subunit
MTHPFRATILWLCRMAEWVAIVALIAATALIMAQIVAREVFVTGLSWADELARYAGLTVIFMAVPALLARNEHVKVDMFLDMMPPRPRRFFNITNDVLMVVFAAMFLIAGWQFMKRAARFSTPALGMPNLIFYMPAAIGMLLLLLVAIDRAVAALTSAPKDEADAP